MTRLFSNALQNDKISLSSLYGSIAGLAELGGEVIKIFIVPRLKFISNRIEPYLNTTGPTIPNNADKIVAGHIRALLQKSCVPVIKTMRDPPDVIEEFK